MIDTRKYNKDIKKAIKHFWDTRSNQLSKQKNSNSSDQGSRGAVTGGKQLDGFIELLKKIVIDVGINEKYIYTKGNHLPGFFRPSKDWDFLVISPKNHLIASIELKSQVGSFGNNFNNRTEEALGSAVDFWTAFKENAFPNQQPPWLGYLLIVEKSLKSTKNVRINEPHFKVLSEFNNTSYSDRYKLFCQKLMLERHYSGTSLILTNDDYEFFSESEVSIYSFLNSFIGYLEGKVIEFK